MDSPTSSCSSDSGSLPSPFAEEVKFARSLSENAIRPLEDYPTFNKQMSLPLGAGDHKMVVHGNYIRGNIIPVYSQCLGSPVRSRPLTDWDSLSERVSVHSVEEEIRQELQKDPPNTEEIAKALHLLADLTESFSEPRLDFMNLVLHVMNSHPRQLLIQRNAMLSLIGLKNCLTYYTFNQQYIKIMNEVVSSIERFPFDVPLLQLALELMYSLRRCFRSSDFNAWNCAKIVLNGLTFRYDNNSIQTISLSILSNLIPNMPESDLQKIGEDQNYRQLLCKIVEEKYSEDVCDKELKIVLDIWGELSYFLHIRYHIVQESKLELFMELLNKFQNDLQVKQKILTILEFVSRLEDAYLHYVKKQFLHMLINFTDDENLEVNFLSASILVHVVRYSKELINNINGLSVEILLSSIKIAMSKWKSPREPLTKYGSFAALWDIMTRSKYEQLQLYAAWILSHLCETDSSKHYVRLIETENLVESIKNFLPQCYKNYELSNACHDMIELMGIRIDLYKFDVTVLSRKYKPLFRAMLIDLENYELNGINVREIFQPLFNALKDKHEIDSAQNLTEVILDIAEYYVKNENILIAILQCLSLMMQNCTLSSSVPCSKIINFCLNILEKFSQIQSIQEECLETLYHSACHPFENKSKYTCVRTVLDLLHKTENNAINEKCVKIAALITSTLPEEILHELGNETDYKNKLFSIINVLLTLKNYCSIHLDALTLFYYLISFRNTVAIALHNNLESFVHIVTIFFRQKDITKRVLPIIIREFFYYPSQKVPDRLKEPLKVLIQSEEFDISHCAAIIYFVILREDAHHSRKFVEKWKNQTVKKNEIIPISLNILGNLYFTNYSLFALWILHQAISREPSKYCKLIKNVGDEEEILMIIDSSPNSDEVKLASEIMQYLNSFSFEMEKIDVVDKLLHLYSVDPYTLQRCLHCLRLHSEYENKSGSIELDKLIALLIHYWRYSGVQREGLAFINATSTYINQNVDSSPKLKTKIIQQISQNHWRYFSKTVFHYSAKCLITLNYDSFAQVYTVLCLIVDSIYEFANNDELNTCLEILTNISASIKPGVKFSDWKNYKIYLQSLYKFIDSRFTFNIPNNEMLFRCFLKLICCLNQFDIKFHCNFRQMKLTAKFLKKFGSISNIENDAAIAVSSMCQRLDENVDITSIDFCDSGNRLIGFARRLLKNSNLMIRFCAIVMSVHLTRTQNMRYFMEDSLGKDVISACLREVKETVLQLEPKQLDVNINTAYYLPSKLKELLSNNQAECRLFAIWVFRHLYLGKDGVAEYGLQYKKEILDIIDQLSVKSEKDENVKRMSMNIVQYAHDKIIA